MVVDVVWYSIIKVIFWIGRFGVLFSQRYRFSEFSLGYAYFPTTEWSNFSIALGATRGFEVMMLFLFWLKIRVIKTMCFRQNQLW